MPAAAQATSTTPLVISFSGALSALYYRRIAPSDLDGAVFYFGCTRTHVFENGVGGEMGEMWSEHREDPEGVEKVYQTLVVALRAAEADGRVEWRELHESPSWGQLNLLLERNGLTPIAPTPSDALTPSFSYSYPEVISRVEQQMLPYRVIWNQ